MFCYAWMKRSHKPMQACVQCSAGKCSMSFHVTCALAAGIPFESCDWPFLIYVTCPRHLGNKEKLHKSVSATQYLLMTEVIHTENFNFLMFLFTLICNNKKMFSFCFPLKSYYLVIVNSYFYVPVWLYFIVPSAVFFLLVCIFLFNDALQFLIRIKHKRLFCHGNDIDDLLFL